MRSSGNAPSDEGTVPVRAADPATELDAAAGPPSRLLEALPTLGGRYDVVGLLGGGGMGSVYLAHDLELDERVAVKVLTATLLETKEQLELLRREVKLARKVTHPNVVRTFDIGTHEGAKFLTMEYVPGSTLADALGGGPMSIPDVLRVGAAICAGLGAAHDAGILHRDLKPANVLIADDGRTLLSDFGISSLVTSGAGAQISGTPPYMAPETLRGEPADSRADIYALGVVLYEMLTGIRPFPIRTIEDAIAFIAERMPDPAPHRADIPPAVWRVVSRALAKTPDQRFSHPREVGAALASAVPNLSDTTLRLGTARPRRTRVLAVLPFAAEGLAPEDAALADGFTALLSDRITSLDVRVLSPGEVARDGVTATNNAEVGRRLGAELVVSGALSHHANGMITIDVRVDGTRDGVALMAHSLARPVRDLSLVADEASTAIARALLVESDAASAQTLAGDAVELYLRGLAEYRRRWRGANDAAVDCLRRARELLPDEPMVNALFAQALVRAHAFSNEPGLLDAARVACARSLGLARDRPEPHLAAAALAMQLGENVEAARSLVVALSLGPHVAEVHERLGLLALEAVDIGEAIARLTTAATLDASLAHARWWIGLAHTFRGDWSRADEILAAVPADTQRLNTYFEVRTRIAQYRPEPARVARLRADVEAAPAFDMRPFVLSGIAVLEGTAREMKTVFGGNEVGASRRRLSFAAQRKTEVALVCNDPERALSCLTIADEHGFIDIQWLDHCPLLVPLRGRPEYERIREHVATRAAAVAAILAPAFGHAAGAAR